MNNVVLHISKIYKSDRQTNKFFINSIESMSVPE